MTTVLIVLHVLVSVFLIAVVLLQRGRGAEIGAVFGGGASSTVFGSRGAGSFLSKLTTAAAAIFMITSLSLSYVWTTQSSDRLFDEETLEQQAAEPEAESLFEEVGTAPAAEGGSLLEEIGAEPSGGAQPSAAAPPAGAPSAAAPAPAAPGTGAAGEPAQTPPAP
jgi:preprotein translocase subunit SecG